MRGLHRVLATALRAGAEVSRVAEHLSQRNESVDLLRAAAGLEALDLTTAGVEVADHVAHVLVGDDDAAFWQASLKAMEPAILNAISEESTS